MSKLKVAVTGGIGSGKSFLSDIIKSLGYKVNSCDEISRKVAKKRHIKKQIKGAFPTAVKGKIKLTVDRKELASIVFKDENKLKTLNGIFHPAIMKEAFSWADKQKDEKVFIEVPLLFEENYQNKFDKIIVVKRELHDRIQSVITRSGLNEEQILERIKSQFNYDTADLSAYIVIENDGHLENRVEEIEKLIKNL